MEVNANPHKGSKTEHEYVYSQVGEKDGWTGTVGLDILHSVPFVDTELTGWDPALVVADPGQEQAAWVVVMAASHLAGFVEWLQGRPGSHKETSFCYESHKWVNTQTFNLKCEEKGDINYVVR